MGLLAQWDERSLEDSERNVSPHNSGPVRMFLVCVQEEAVCLTVGVCWWGWVEGGFHWEYSDDNPKAKPHGITRKTY